jgi:energy-coupling factor transporter transmembrane protein EcfT
MLLIDLILSLVVSLILSWIFLRFVHEHGPWRRPWAFALVIFLFAWAGGAWVAPGLSSGWLTYWIPFVLVGLVTAVLIVTASPRHNLDSAEDIDQFKREETAVLYSVTVLMWVLVAMAIAAIVTGYLR